MLSQLCFTGCVTISLRKVKQNIFVKIAFHQRRKTHIIHNMLFLNSTKNKTLNDTRLKLNETIEFPYTKCGCEAWIIETRKKVRLKLHTFNSYGLLKAVRENIASGIKISVTWNKYFPQYVNVLYKPSP